MAACLTDKQLADYHSGAANVAEVRAIEGHLESCAACCRRLEEASTGDDVLDGVIRVMEAGDDTVTTAGATRQFEIDVRAATAAHIEGYEIVKELGRGGMGVVYLAIQQSTKRKVALKVLLEGPFASASAKRRFEREVELAAQLNHPDVVSIIDSGVSSGRYYFAMQYVDGQRLDHYIVQKNLNRQEMLNLFRRTCQAVHYAHQQGIIHRDLKPSNILVDQDGHPHILDFGLARPTSDPVEDVEAAQALSVTGQVIGTLPYMSPEQAFGRRNDIDIRTDIYSLGVILYEMLTGRFPYKVVGQVADVLHNIAQVAPEKPSSLGHKINNEMETIVLKALAKEKDRRYQSAENLARDIERFLSGDPIEAKRDSGWYVFTKTMSRYRSPVLTATAVVVLVVIGVFLLWRKNVRLAQAAAGQTLALFVDDPGQALAQASAAPDRVRRFMAATAESDVESPAYTQRIVGARSAWLLSPAAFWASVDGGALWENGEWLELADLPVDDVAALIPELRQKAETGSPRERYVGFCLLGWLVTDDAELGRFCADAARKEKHPGVAAAAWWAARRLGADASPTANEKVLIDDLADTVFVEVPGDADFRRGSPASDPDRYADEDRPATGVDLMPLFVSQTEVTWKAFRRFLNDPASAGHYGAPQREFMANLLGSLKPGERAEAAVGYVSLTDARAYCAWLSALGRAADPPRSYRLLTEDEWEHAARGGNSGRFCYGDSAKYTRYFAYCDGAEEGWHRVARRAPNWYGLFDMHGGVWEWCDSRYWPEENAEVWVYRGGAYHSPAVRCRSAQRNYGSAEAYGTYHGFRIALQWGAS